MAILELKDFLGRPLHIYAEPPDQSGLLPPNPQAVEDRQRVEITRLNQTKLSDKQIWAQAEANRAAHQKAPNS